MTNQDQPLQWEVRAVPSRTRRTMRYEAHYLGGPWLRITRPKFLNLIAKGTPQVTE